jgi:hypothetical protein
MEGSITKLEQERVCIAERTGKGRERRMERDGGKGTNTSVSVFWDICSLLCVLNHAGLILL